MMRLLFILILGLLGAVSLSGQDAGKAKDALSRSTIDSDTLEMQGTEKNNYFYFGGNVHVVGTDLEINCDELTVRAKRGGDEKSTVGELGAVEEIVAVGNVRINQAGRVATAGRVVVDPVKGTIHFLEKPVIVQGDMEASAYGFVFYTNDKRLEALNPPGFQPGKEGRSKISLSAMPKITFDLPEDSVTVGADSTKKTDLPTEEATEIDEENAGSVEETPAPEEGGEQ